MFDVAAYAELTKAMKSADTTAENKATPWARATLTALIAGDLTIATMTAALCAAYKPRTASGKLATTIGALPASPRGRANTMKYIYDNLGVDGVRPVVDAFICETAKDAPKTIAALHSAVKAAIKVAGEALAGEEPESDSEGETEGEGAANAKAGNPSTADILATFAPFIRGLSDADIADHADLIADVLVACREAAAKLEAMTSPEALAA
jgi:hypothetical protein